MIEKVLRQLGDALAGESAHRPAPGRVPVTARLARSARGSVAPHAEDAVARAASSSGAPLPGDVRARFEGSLGADLSGVRVHTGAESADAAASVGARAYAVGDDIHFAGGAYAPADPFGIHLLAHEVAHTVQQSGGAPHRQHKLDVSSPGDGAEVEADRAADAMAAGQPFAVGEAAGAMQRKTITLPTVDARHHKRRRHGWELAQPAVLSKNATGIAMSTEVPAPGFERNGASLCDAILGTHAFDRVPKGDALYNTLANACTTDVWARPYEARPFHLEAYVGGRKGMWNLSIKPVLLLAHYAPNGTAARATISDSATTSVTGGETTLGAAGAEASGEMSATPAGIGVKGAGKLSSLDTEADAHGVVAGGGTSTQMTVDLLRFEGTISFEVHIDGSWESKNAAGRLRDGAAEVVDDISHPNGLSALPAVADVKAIGAAFASESDAGPMAEVETRWVTTIQFFVPKSECNRL